MASLIYFIIGLLAFPIVLVVNRFLFPARFRRLVLNVASALKAELSSLDQLTRHARVIINEKQQNIDQVKYALKLIASLGYTLHHIDDDHEGILAVNHSWKVRYFLAVGNFLQHVRFINLDSDQSLILLDKPLLHLLDKNDGYYNSDQSGLNPLLEILPGFENRTLLDVINLLYGLIHENTEADLDGFLKRHFGLRLPDQPVDLSPEGTM